jgi:hypothetical protein
VVGDAERSSAGGTIREGVESDKMGLGPDLVAAWGSPGGDDLRLLDSGTAIQRVGWRVCLSTGEQGTHDLFVASQQLSRSTWTVSVRSVAVFTRLKRSLSPFVRRTNATSTDLNIRLDALSRSSNGSARSPPTNSALVYAIRDKGSAIIPEHRIYFAFSALNVLVAGSARGLSGSGLSEHAQQALALATASRGKAILNSAIPGKIDEALTRPNGLGHLSEACVSNPKSLDVALFKIGGVAVALRLVELATTPRQLMTTIQLFVEVIGHSWRNSEDTGRYLALSSQLVPC